MRLGRYHQSILTCVYVKNCEGGAYESGQKLRQLRNWIDSSAAGVADADLRDLRVREAGKATLSAAYCVFEGKATGEGEVADGAG